MYELDTFTAHGYDVRIIADEDAQDLDPLAGTDVGAVYAWGYRGGYVDDVLESAEYVHYWDEYEDAGPDIAPGDLVVPLRYLSSNHGPGTATLDVIEPDDDRTTPNAAWVIDAADVASEFGTRADALAYVAAVCAEWQAWANGDVWGYVIEQDGAEVDSLWGMIDGDVYADDSYVRETARESAEYMRVQANIERDKRREIMTVRGEN